MKKKIATLEVYTDSEYDNNAMEDHNNGQYQLILGRDRDADQKLLQTVMAHELGHFIALVTKDRTHDKAYNLYSRVTGDPGPLVPGEELAWELAEKMIPRENFDYAKEEEALKGYREAAKEAEDEYRAFLRNSALDLFKV